MSQTLGAVEIGILVYPSCLRSGAVVPVDVLRIANTLAQQRPAAQRVQFNTHWLSARGEHSVAAGGLRFDTGLLGERRLDALLLPGVDHRMPEDLKQACALLAPERTALRKFADEGGLLLSGCSSTCLLAETGVLDGRRATTSWWLSSYFRKRYPAVLLDAEALIVEDGSFVSSGGVTSYFDLSLWLVGHFAGDALRQMVSRVMVMESTRASQAPYVATAMIQSEGHALIEMARRWLNEHLDQPWQLAALAEHCHTSQRTLLRRFQEVVGCSPVHYTQQLRVERAKVLLESTRLSLQEITGRCGYEDVSTFSKTFKRWAQLTPSAYRSRFGLRV